MADRLTDGTYQSHLIDISEPGAQISLQGVDDTERGDLEEGGDNPDEEAVSVKTKKWTTRGLVDARIQASLHQCPGNDTELVFFH